MKKISITFIVVLIFCLFCFAQADPREEMRKARQENTEMRKNLAWLMEGLLILSSHKEKTLALSKTQAQKILPLLNELVAKKIIDVEINEEQRQWGSRNRGNQGNQGGGFWNMDEAQLQKFLKTMKEQTKLGNDKIDQIDNLLKEKQISFIDNMKFDGKKYGFFETRQFRNQGEEMQRPDAAQMEAMRKRMQEARKRLVKLNNDVLQALAKLSK